MKQIEGQMSLFDILEPENAEKCSTPALKCSDCAHFIHYVCGLGECYHGTACVKDRPFAVDKDPEDTACKDYIRRGGN